jgi:hypothetical protein
MAGEPGAKLHLVPPAEPTPREKVVQRVKSAPRPDGMLQCNRCGSRTVLNTENGVIVKNGRRQRGTRIDKDVCADCWKQGIHSPMRPVMKPA